MPESTCSYCHEPITIGAQQKHQKCKELFESGYSAGSKTFKRMPVTSEATAQVMRDFMTNYHAVIGEKGEGAFISTHEAFGAVAEEYLEYWEVVRKNNINGIRKELHDLMVACAFALASMEVGYIEIDRKEWQG